MYLKSRTGFNADGFGVSIGGTGGETVELGADNDTESEG